MFKGKGAEIYISSVELVLVITAAAAITFSAETVQLKANEVRVTFMCSESNNYSTGVIGKWVKLFEDRNALSLTAWRMFTIQRSILLSLFAWPFVYGLVLVNFL
ncbi:hypothetical protein CDAR_266041 [Caerostris darwini]|uniref:Uncharacterized protein n=1 Tax=Caerostris darwini TaxID=1538125 RepID=A0AAV4QSQ2_9ARAC|nr:hypothetical protein CDAR_266041 [Caerostris darwini]